jgi:prephenate dehydratase
MFVSTVGYLGPKASFTEQAVKRIFEENQRVPFESIYDCLDAVKNGDVLYGIVPLENTIEGSVTLTLDYLIHEHPLSIIGEIIVPIKQLIMVHPENVNERDSLTTVYSHPHALAQCRKFLAVNYPGATQIQTLSTSAAAQYVAKHPNEKLAAIANELAAEEYGLTTIETNIHDYENNHTRFIVVQNDREKVVPFSSAPSTKTTLIITLPSDQAGALHQVLAAFAWRKISLSKIESRPMKTGLGRYLFIIDLEAAIDSVLIPSAINELEALGCGVVCLGSYPVFVNKALI